MTVNPTLADVYSKKQVLDGVGNPVNPFPTAIPRETGEVLYNLVKREDCTNTLEVGMAYGLSTLFICQAHHERGAGHHIAIDPTQSGEWKAIGLLNVERAGYSKYLEFFEMQSSAALPKLIERGGERLDFAFIDGSHRFDYALVDFFLIDKILKVGGLIAFDDLWMPAVRRVINFAVTNRHYSLQEAHTQATLSNHARSYLRRMAQDPFERDAGGIKRIAGNICILKKEAEDDRSWDYHRVF